MGRLQQEGSATLQQFPVLRQVAYSVVVSKMCSPNSPKRSRSPKRERATDRRFGSP